MTINLRDKMKHLSPERRTRINAETHRLHNEYKTLQELRKTRESMAVPWP